MTQHRRQTIPQRLGWLWRIGAAAAFLLWSPVMAIADEPMSITDEGELTRPRGAGVDVAYQPPANPPNGQQPEPSLLDLPLEQLAQQRVRAPALEQEGTMTLQQEVTTVSRQVSSVGKSPAAVFVITNEMIRRSGATTIPETLRMVPGLDVARIDNNKWAISSRGFNERFGRFLLVQIDGRVVYNPIFSGVYWDAVDYPLQDIDRIEVIRGPGATVWGANAVNGIINIITKQTKDTQGGLTSAGGGNLEQGFGTFRYGGQINDDLSYRVYGKGFNRATQFAPFDVPNDQWQGGSTGLRMDWQRSDCDTVTLDAGYLRSVAGRNDSRPSPFPAFGPPFTPAAFTFKNLEDEVSNNSHVLYRWSHTEDKDTGWALQAYWDDFRRTSSNDFFSLRWDTYDVDFQQHFLLGDRHHIVYGLGYRFVDAFLGGSTRDDEFAVDFVTAHRQTNLPNVFVQDQIDVVEDRLAVIFGTKMEVNSFTDFQVQPTARLLWTPTERQTAWASFSRALRTPSLTDDKLGIKLLPVSLPAPPFPAGSLGFPDVRGNTDLDNEQLLAYELGYRATPRDEFSWDIALFYNDYNQVRATRGLASEPGPLPLTFILPQLRVNGLDAETYGVEVAANRKLTDWWQLYGQYTFLQMQLHRGPGIAASQEAPEGQSPANQVYLSSAWNLNSDWEFDLIGRYVDQLSGFNVADPNSVQVPNTIPKYLALDARLAWRPCPQREFALVGQNLTDNHHPESGTSSTLASPLIEIRRNVFGTFTMTW